MSTFSLIAMLFACHAIVPEAQGHSPEPIVSEAAASKVVGQVVQITTTDGVALEMDVYKGGASVVVLLHMIPPHFERSSWPQDFIGQLTDQGWTVAVPDRRGAGQSKGLAEEAYKGPGGREDVAAVVRHLKTLGPVDKLAVIGASNGTTAMVDYANWAGQNQMPVPVLLGFMTGGTYTENNLAMSEVKDFPAVFTYSVKEREWSESQRQVSPEWVFHEYEGGEHGTKMFAVRPQVSTDLLTALQTAL